MGNHQFGFMNRPPEFIGKSWSYVMEKRRKSSATKRPSSTTSFSDVCASNGNNEEVRTASPNRSAWRNRRSVSEPHDSPSKPFFRSIRRRGSIKHSRSTLRCSPTVPEALTLSFDVAAAGIGVGLGAVANADAVASALNAIQKLTPAAPRLFKEPVFDEFFEEAERRNLTMEVLQAALTAPSSSTEDEELKPPQATGKRRSPAATMASGRSKEHLNVIYASSCEDEGSDRITTSSYTTSEAEGISSSHHLVVIVAGGSGGSTASGEATETGQWGKCPPTLIVQPGNRSLFSSGSSACLTTTPTIIASSTAPGSSSGGGPSPRSEETRRGSGNPNSTSVPPSAPLGVRFADQTAPICLSESDDAGSNRHASISTADSARPNRRASFRRKTIGAVVDLDPPDGSAATSGPNIASEMVTVTKATLRPLTQRSEEHRPSGATTLLQQPSLRKKSLSRSDLLCPPPIITLLKQPQINLIRQLWQQLYNTKGPTVLGNHVFQRVFFKNPQIKDVFRNVDVGNKHINVDCMCKGHAKAVAAVLDDVVRNLENLREVESKLMDVGRKHAIFYDLGFHINFWSVFAEAFIDCTLEWGEKNRRVEESRKAWAIIINYITDKMKFGFQEARRNLPRPGRRTRHSDAADGSASASS